MADPGCGLGNSTALLAKRWVGTTLIGVDPSFAMLEKTRHFLPLCRFAEADMTSWQADAPFGLVFANASLSWASGHEKRIPLFLVQLAENGVLAVQVPDNLDEPSRAARKTGSVMPQLSGRACRQPV